jgi:hypothetical protein
MKTQITRYLGTLAIAAALLTTTTSAFAATPGSVSPALYDDSSAETGDDVASGLEYGGAALDVGAAIVGVAAGGTEEGQITAGSLAVGGTALSDVAAPIVRLGTR